MMQECLVMSILTVVSCRRRDPDIRMLCCDQHRGYCKWRHQSRRSDCSATGGWNLCKCHTPGRCKYSLVQHYCSTSSSITKRKTIAAPVATGAASWVYQYKIIICCFTLYMIDWKLFTVIYKDDQMNLYMTFTLPLLFIERE